MSKKFTPAEAVEALSDLVNEVAKRLPPQALCRLCEKHPILEAIYEDGVFDIKIEGTNPSDEVACIY